MLHVLCFRVIEVIMNFTLIGTRGKTIKSGQPHGNRFLQSRTAIF